MRSHGILKLGDTTYVISGKICKSLSGQNWNMEVQKKKKQKKKEKDVSKNGYK